MTFFNCASEYFARPVGVMFGAIAQRTHYCSMGALADVVGFGDWSRLRMWALAGGVAMPGGRDRMVVTGPRAVAVVVPC